MKNINLISESKLLQEKHFYVTNYHGKETVVFRITENEFVHKSLYLFAYSADFKPLPYKQETVQGLEFAKIKDYYCGVDFYIIADKGTIGFDSIVYISKCHIEETETEFIIKVMLETNEGIKNSLLEAYGRNDASMTFFFHDNFYSRINECLAPVTELAKKAEETPFLDIDEDNDYAIPLRIDVTGAYQFGANSKYYELMNPKEPIEVGSYLYTRYMENCAEIVEIQQIAHSPYGRFYAVLKLVYIFPKDKKEIEQQFPQFYKEQCFTKAERAIKNFIGTPENLSFISKENEIGEPIIYQPLNVSSGYPGISNKIFQFMIGGRSGFGDYEVPDGVFIRVERGVMVGTLIQVDGRFKIVLYKCETVVKYRNKNYVKFKYEDESDFFNDFSNASKSAFKKCHHRDTCRNVEFLLCRDKIKPVIISKEKYEAFSRNR